ncbi:VOC family protein [Undibacterium fentianense]|uniref:VOC family protein n=1 Tax=Undibacterium fentianense TaxID=2828728 RepID=A0A941E689_9BURK|nr:VOC family protein [Undibacterium fentianense]MBR7800518.1 VOC family protein [Undibacterium fentianense]
MFSHIVVGITDFERALAFYRPLMAVLGITSRFCDPSRPWAGWQSHPDPRPLFVIARPFDQQIAHPGNGQTIALMAATHAMVEQAYQVALLHGGQCEGPPGLRPAYHADYYGAYFRDPDGNKLCVVCHTSEIK